MQKFSSIKTIYVFSCAIVVIQLLISLSLIIVSEVYSRVIIMKYFQKTEQNEMKLIFYFIDIYGVHLFLTYCCAFRILPKPNRDPGPTIIWILFALVASIDGFLIELVFFQRVNDIKELIRKSLTDGLKLYYKDPVWRFFWDDIQFNRQCCGIDHFNDWKEISPFEIKNKELRQYDKFYFFLFFLPLYTI